MIGFFVPRSTLDIFPIAAHWRALMPLRQQAYTVERLQEAAKTAETKAREYVVSKKWDGVTIACRWLRTCMMYHNGGTETER